MLCWKITMKRILSICLSIFMLVPLAVPLAKKKLNKLQESQHKAMHEIVMVQRNDSEEVVEAELCTAYAVGPHTLMTAEHCNYDKVDKVYVDPINKDAVKKDQSASYKITDTYFDHQDHMLMDLQGVVFKDIVFLRPNVRLPKQSEHTYTWGNPAGIRDQYREGRVMGTMLFESIQEVDAKGPLLYLVQTTVASGDSGSAVFSEKDGALIGIILFI